MNNKVSTKLHFLAKWGKRNIKFLLKKYRKQTICGWSINAVKVSNRWEKSAVSPKERIDCAKMVYDLGYDTRIRIDPIFPIYDWQKHYQTIIDYLFSKFKPNKIILGTPRGLWKTLKYAKAAGVDMSWSNFFSEDSSWGKKLEFNQRKQIYQFFFDTLKNNGYSRSEISLCKETTSMWKELGLHYKPFTCNCYGSSALTKKII